MCHFIFKTASFKIKQKYKKKITIAQHRSWVIFHRIKFTYISEWPETHTLYVHIIKGDKSSIHKRHGIK